MWLLADGQAVLLAADLDEDILEIMLEDVTRGHPAGARVEHEYDEDNPDWYDLLDRGDYLEWLANEDFDDADDAPEQVLDRPGAAVAAPQRPGHLAEPRPKIPAGGRTVEIRFSDARAQDGYEFEKWVVRRFDRNKLSLTDWRSDKGVDGWTPQSSMDPDLQFGYRLPGEDRARMFGVECKWRKDYWQGGIQWSDAEQIQRYEKYRRKLLRPVFVVIGVGGSPDAPCHVHVAPLQACSEPFLTLDQLAGFRRRIPDAPFVWDPYSKVLS